MRLDLTSCLVDWRRTVSATHMLPQNSCYTCKSCQQQYVRHVLELIAPGLLGHVVSIQDCLGKIHWSMVDASMPGASSGATRPSASAPLSRGSGIIFLWRRWLSFFSLPFPKRDKAAASYPSQP